MSDILKGLIVTELNSAFPTNTFNQNDKFAEALAKAIQQYLNTSVQTVPAPGPVNHVHPTLLAK